MKNAAIPKTPLIKKLKFYFNFALWVMGLYPLLRKGKA